MEKEELVKKIFKYKELVEGKIVGAFWKQPDLLYDYTDMKLEDFKHNKWRVYYQIIYDLYIVEKRPVIDDVVVGIYLEKHLSLKAKYEEYGGYEKIELLSNEFTKVENLSADVDESNKWNTVLELIKNGFPIDEDKLKHFVDVSLDDIYDEYETMLNHLFIKVNSDVQSYDISDGIDDLVDDLDKGQLVGLEYNNMPMLTKLTNGCSEGNVTIILAPSGYGKSSFVRNAHMTSTLLNNERIVIFLNEEGLGKWQREFICWVANNIFKESLQKHIITNGHYSGEIRQLIDKCKEWIKSKKEERLITIIPFNEYRVKTLLKCVRKYASMGIKYFVIDTFKADYDAKADDWARLEQDMRQIYDLIKDSNKNVHMLATMQIRLSDIRARYLTLDNVAQAKSTVNVASTVIMLRRLFDDELPGEGKKATELKVYKQDDDNEKISEIVPLDPKKKYFLAFIGKNREGESGYRQIVFENDLSRNVMKEVGYTTVPFV